MLTRRDATEQRGSSCPMNSTISMTMCDMECQKHQYHVYSPKIAKRIFLVFFHPPSTMSKVFKIIPTTQQYDWGKQGQQSKVYQLALSSQIPGFQQLDEAKPYAELWMGTHPTSPSHVLSDSTVKLSEYLKEHPELIGNGVLSKFPDGKEGNLPFLFKVYTSPVFFHLTLTYRRPRCYLSRRLYRFKRTQINPPQRNFTQKGLTCTKARNLSTSFTAILTPISVRSQSQARTCTRTDSLPCPLWLPAAFQYRS